VKTILSLFDYSGQWSAPYLDAGHNVIQLDLKHDDRHNVAKFSVAYLVEELGLDVVDGILAAPPCTDFTCSGNRHWAKKDADGRTAASRELVLQVIRCVEYFKPDFWVIENPVGRLAKLVQGLGQPFVFHPHQFAGHVDETLTPAELDRLTALEDAWEYGEPFTKADLELVKRSNRYKKRTCLWGRFNTPNDFHRSAIRVCAAGSWLMTLGGKSDATKEARSDTPAGFARAFFEANNWTAGQAHAWAAERAAEACLYLLEGDLDATQAEVLSVFEPDEHPGVTEATLMDAWFTLYSKTGRQRAALAALAV
jgi:hypothetical protein